MYRTQHHHYLAENRRQANITLREHQAVRQGHEFAWEFGGILEYSDWSAYMSGGTRAVVTATSLDKALALAG
jgi:hypothetical protein